MGGTNTRPASLPHSIVSNGDVFKLGVYRPGDPTTLHTDEIDKWCLAVSKRIQNSTPIRIFHVDASRCTLLRNTYQSSQALHKGLLTLLKQHKKTITTLEYVGSPYLYLGQEDDLKIGVKRCEAICEIISCQNLQVLNLSKSSTHKNWSLVPSVCQALIQYNNPKLQTLDFSGIPVYPSGYIELAKFLKQNKSLVTLNLYATQLDDVGATALADALLYNRQLEVLLLGGNQFGEVGTKALADTMWTNPKLKSISLLSHGNPETSHQVHKMVEINKNLWPLCRMVCLGHQKGTLQVLPKDVVGIIVVFLKQLQYFASV